MTAQVIVSEHELCLRFCLPGSARQRLFELGFLVPCCLPGWLTACGAKHLASFKMQSLLGSWFQFMDYSMADTSPMQRQHKFELYDSEDVDHMLMQQMFCDYGKFPNLIPRHMCVWGSHQLIPGRKPTLIDLFWMLCRNQVIMFVLVMKEIMFYLMSIRIILCFFWLIVVLPGSVCQDCCKMFCENRAQEITWRTGVQYVVRLFTCLSNTEK